MGYNQVFGYYIEVSKSQTDGLPDDYIRRQTLTNAERYIVPELKEYESRVLNAREQMAVEEDAVYRRVCSQVAESAARTSPAPPLPSRRWMYSAGWPRRRSTTGM